MTASDKAKNKGLKSLKEVCDLTGVSFQTLNNWSNDKPELFEVVLLGCVKEAGTEDAIITPLSFLNRPGVAGEQEKRRIG